MKVKQFSNGWYAVGKRSHFLVRHSSHINCSTGVLTTNNISFPKEFVGKKIRLKIEILEDKVKRTRTKHKDGEDIIFDFEPVIHFNKGNRTYACNVHCNTNPEKLTTNKRLVTCRACKAYLRRMAQ